MQIRLSGQGGIERVSICVLTRARGRVGIRRMSSCALTRERGQVGIRRMSTCALTRERSGVGRPSLVLRAVRNKPGGPKQESCEPNCDLELRLGRFQQRNSQQRVSSDERSARSQVSEQRLAWSRESSKPRVTPGANPKYEYEYS